MRIGFIGFGEAARAFQESLAARNASLQFAAYDILLETEGTSGACAQAMRDRSVAIAFPRKTALGETDWIFSAVTADQSLEAARAAADYLRQGQVFFDINSVSPDRKRATAELLSRTSAFYVDMAVMAPVHPKGHRTATLIAGAQTATLSKQLMELEFDFEIVGVQPGAATAIKMVRSLFVKGLEAITVETLLAASASGCLDYVLDSLSRTYPAFGLPALARYHFERTLKHGKRRAAEMRESAATLEALGLYGRLADAIADIQERMGELPQNDLSGADLADELKGLVALRRGEPASG